MRDKVRAAVDHYYREVAKLALEAGANGMDLCVGPMLSRGIESDDDGKIWVGFNHYQCGPGHIPPAKWTVYHSAEYVRNPPPPSPPT